MSKKETVAQSSTANYATKDLKLIGDKPSFKERLFNFWKTYGYLAIAMAIPALIFFLIYFARYIVSVYDDNSGFKDTVLVLDLNGQYVYFFEALRNTVLEGGSLLYSWSRALGGEFLGMYAYYIASPLSYLVCLFPKDRTQEFLLVLFMIKAALCAGTMGFYLHKHSVTKNKIFVIIFSVMYALSAYCVVQQSNTMWIDAVMWLPLVIYGVEQVVKYGKYKVYVIFLALTLASNFYIGYMVCLFVLLYFFYYMIAYSKNYVNNPRLERFHFFKSFVRMGIFSLIAIGIAAVIIFTAYYSLQFGKNEFTDPSWDLELRFDVYDLFFKLLPSSYDTVRIDGLPFVYCGVLTLLLAPLFFISKKFTVREKVASGVFLLVLSLGFIVSVFDLVWHGFQKPQWLNARFSFMFCFLLIFLAFRAFERIKSINMWVAGAVAVFIGGGASLFGMYAKEFEDKLVELKYGPNAEDFEVHILETVLLTVACLAVYLAIMAFMKKEKKKNMIATALLVLVCGELYVNGLVCVNEFDQDVGFTTYASYNEFNNLMRPISDTLTKEYDTSFYRFEKTYHRKLNDNMALSIRGVSNSTSTLNKSTINFLRNLGYYSQSHKSQYKGGTVATDSLIGMKYIISNRDYSSLYGDPVLTGKDYAEHLGLTLDQLKESTTTTKYTNYLTPQAGDYFSTADFNVYLNPYALSLAFAATDEILEVNVKDHNDQISETHKDYEEKFNPDGYKSPFTRVNAIYSAILGEYVEIFKPAVQTNVYLDKVTHKVSSEHDRYVTVDTTTVWVKKDENGNEIVAKAGESGAYQKEVNVKDSVFDQDKHIDKKNSKTTLVKDYGSVTFTFSVPDDGRMLYLFLPAHYNREVDISSPTMKIFDSTRSDGTLNHSKTSAGSFSKCNDRIVELGFSTQKEYKLKVTIDNSSYQFYTKKDQPLLYYVDMELFEDVINRIKQNQLILDKEFKDDDIHGKITTANDDQLIMTTIPYDAGWKVYVDGKTVETFEIADALVGFRIEGAGEHTVRFLYRSDAFVGGIMVSVICTGLFVLLIVLEKFLKKIPMVKAFIPPETEDFIVVEYDEDEEEVKEIPAPQNKKKHKK